jgi:hypothetical protein
MRCIPHLYFEVLTKNNQIPTHSLSAAVHVANEPFLNAQQFHSVVGDFVSHPQWVLVVAPYALALSCIALFALDALAERLQISRPRRILLCGVEAVALWHMTAWWGHPENALAVALAVYCFIFILDMKLRMAGWFFGAAVAFSASGPAHAACPDGDRGATPHARLRDPVPRSGCCPAYGTARCQFSGQNSRRA